MRCYRLEDEKKWLSARVVSLEPVSVARDVAAEDVHVQRALTALHGKLRVAESKWRRCRRRRAALWTSTAWRCCTTRARCRGQVKSQMNDYNFQFRRQWRRQQRAEIEPLKEEWRRKLEALDHREAELDEKVVVAARNMNEVVF